MATAILDTRPMANKEPHEEVVSLLTANQTRLRAYILSLTADREVAMEVLQETNLVIWRKSRNFVLGSNFIAWAFKIARLQVLAHREKHSSSQFIFSEEFVEELAEAAREEDGFETLSEMQDALVKCMEELSQQHRDLMWMRYRDKLKISEIAHHVGKKVGATKQMFHRLRIVLMKCIEQKNSEGGLV